MKRIISILMAIFFLTVAFNSCSNSEKFVVKEVAGYDYFSGANHNPEISLSNKYVKEKFVEKEKEIKVNGTLYALEYVETENNYLYNDDSLIYEKKEFGKSLKIAINKTNGRIDRYSWVDINENVLYKMSCVYKYVIQFGLLKGRRGLWVDSPQLIIFY